MTQRTLRVALDERRNSLNALRLFLALLVIVSHAPLAGGFGDPPVIGGLELGGWAVGGFFVISGWLITGSRMRLDMAQFLWRRVLRIYPAFLVALAAVAVVFAPLAVLIGTGVYRPRAAAEYVYTNATLYITHPTIPGSLGDAPYTSHWNLSLWTLQWEFLCYLAIGVLLSFRWVRRRPWVVLAAFVVIAVPFAATQLAGMSLGPGYSQGSRLASSFLVGAIAYFYADRIPATRPWAIGAVAILVIITALGGMRGFGAIPLGFLVLWLGAVLPLEKVGRTNDISYGVYIYAFPVSLLLAVIGAPSLGLVAFTLLSIALVLPFAALSWFVVERPALRLKSMVKKAHQPAHAAQ